MKAYWEAQRDVDPSTDPKWLSLLVELKTEGKVIGHVISTQKEGKVQGLRLLIVETLDENLMSLGKALISTDTVNARIEDIVLLCSSSSARMTSMTKDVCTDNAIVGIVETISSAKADWYKR